MGYTRTFDNLVVKIEAFFTISVKMKEQSENILGVHLTGVDREQRREI